MTGADDGADDDPVGGAPHGVVGAQRVFDLLDTAPAGYIVADAVSGTVWYVNRTLCRVLDRSAEHIIGTDVGAMFASSDVDVLTDLLATAPDASSSASVGAAADLVGAGGDRLPVLLMANAERSPDVEVDGGDARGDDRRGVSVRITVHSALADGARQQLLTDARDVSQQARSLAETACETAEEALGRLQDALETSQAALEAAQAERNRSHMLATTLQRTLLPPILTAPPGMEVAAYYHHAVTEDVGGDFYDLFPLDGRTWGFFLGDVSGKGPGAAVVTSLTRYSLRAAAVFDRDPVTVLHNLNTVLHHEFRGNDPRFCTVVYGTVTPSGEGGAVIELASGGHPPALVLRADGTAQYVHTPGGQLVGALAAPRFTAAHIQLAAGDVFVLYTDGLTEARTGPGRGRYDDYGALERFAQKAAPTTAPGIIDDLVDLLNSFGSGLEDDVALLALS
ncbi:PP2C family protein-serine/threonine phosphatase [Rhodococcoides fascians]|uniref:PP2C family protein-serine/threonine phosphatase n=1 Tax=Rhodococcoides fascians TaxID=1828 RepID=UPI000B24499E|nr:SpoIIE family protein phosphatase [Rhodococcus fascians]